MGQFRVPARLGDGNGPKIPTDIDEYDLVGHTDPQSEYTHYQATDIAIPCSCGETLSISALVLPADIEKAREWNENHNHEGGHS